MHEGDIGSVRMAKGEWGKVRAYTTITLTNGTVGDNTATEIVCTWPGPLTVTVDLLEITGIGCIGRGSGRLCDSLVRDASTVRGIECL